MNARSSLSPRELVLRTLRRKRADRMPVTLDVGASVGIGPAYLDVFARHGGSADPAEFLDYDIRIVDAPLSATADDFSRWYESVPEGTRFDEFGVGHVLSDTFPLGLDLHPWGRLTHCGEVHAYPFPAFELQDAARRRLAEIHSRGYAASAACGSINEWCYSLRGMDQFMIDLMLNHDMAEAILDRVVRLCIATGTALAGAGVDILCFYGDMGSQTSLLMGEPTWRQWILPRWKEIIRAVRSARPEAVVFYHSCGYVEPIIPGLIEAGFDVLNPVQPESMDPFRIKKMYGRKISLWGGIGMQSTMLGADAAGVRRTTRELATAWQEGGGGIVTIAQTLLPDVPWENVLAVIESLRE